MAPSRNRYSIGNIFAPLERNIGSIRLQNIGSRTQKRPSNAGYKIQEEPSQDDLFDTIFQQLKPPLQPPVYPLNSRELLPVYGLSISSSSKPTGFQDDTSVYDTSIYNVSSSGLQIEDDDVQLIETTTNPSRGWRFYGTFACLAILNFICAIDATILSVALPVRLPFINPSLLSPQIYSAQY